MNCASSVHDLWVYEIGIRIAIAYLYCLPVVEWEASWHLYLSGTSKGFHGPSNRVQPLRSAPSTMSSNIGLRLLWTTRWEEVVNASIEAAHQRLQWCSSEDGLWRPPAANKGCHGDERGRQRERKSGCVWWAAVKDNVGHKRQSDSFVRLVAHKEGHVCRYLPRKIRAPASGETTKAVKGLFPPPHGFQGSEPFPARVGLLNSRRQLISIYSAPCCSRNWL